MELTYELVDNEFQSIIKLQNANLVASTAFSWQVGQEDKGGVLIDFADQLQMLGKEMPFFFHAGETNWNGLSTDLNLIDAVLLNAKRIGHG